MGRDALKPAKEQRKASLKRAIEHYKKEIEWKFKDDLDITFESVLKQIAEERLRELT